MVRSCYLCGGKINNLQQISLHRFPHNADEVSIAAKWRQVCGISHDREVTNLRICSAHFNPEDFYARGNFIRHRLKLDAVPSVCVPHSIPGSDLTGEVAISNGQLTCLDNVEATSARKVDQLVGADCQSSTTVLMNRNDEDSLMDIDAVPSPKVTSPRKEPDISTSSSVQSQHDEGVPRTPQARIFSAPRLVTEIITPYVATPRRASQVLTVAKASHKKIILVRRLEASNRRPTAKILELRKRFLEKERHPPEANLADVAHTEDAENDASIEYSLDNADDDLNSLRNEGKMPPNWVHARSAVGISLLQVGQDDAYAGEVLRSIHILPNMSVEVRNIRARGRSSIPINFGRMTNVASIVAAMRSVSGLILCDGIDAVCRGSGFLPSNKLSTAVKCDICRREWKKKKDRELYERKRAAVNKRVQKRRELKNLKRKLSRLQNNMAKSTKEMEELRQQCAKASECTVQAWFKTPPRTFPQPNRKR